MLIYLYSVDVAILHLKLDDFVGDASFHAALVGLHSRRSEHKTPHDHDFWELMYVFKGSGLHLVNGCVVPLQAGTLLLVRPSDCHTFAAPADARLHFINIAFAPAQWRNFCDLAGLTTILHIWASTPLPPAAILRPEQRDACLAAFRTALHAYIEGPTSLALCAFWATVTHYLIPRAVEGTKPGYLWLTRACEAMRDENNIRLGLPRLVKLSGVSPEHLARTFREQRAQTPTEFVNALRLEHAKKLLITTSKDILEVASDCGFDNLSYFYRLFRAYYGQTPRKFRIRARGGVAP